MPKKSQTKKPAAKKPAAAPSAETPKLESPKLEAAKPKPVKTPEQDAPLALRLAVLEDVVRRAAQETRAFQSKLDTFGASHGELARRVGDVEKRVAK